MRTSFTASLLMPGKSIAATIANEFAEADSEQYRSALIALGFVLFLVTFVVLAVARLMLSRLSRREGADAAALRACRRAKNVAGAGSRGAATAFGLFWLAGSCGPR